MKPRSTSIAALWPALLGVLAAHQIAYSGHDDGHVHGYLEKVGPALVVAAVLGWMWSWARARVEFRIVLTMQLVMFVVMEGAERIAATTGFAISDMVPIVAALLLIPLAAALTVLTDRLCDLGIAGAWSLAPVDGSWLSRHAGVVGARPARRARRPIRAPPAFV